MSGWLVALDFGTTATAVAGRSMDGPARAVVFGDGSSTVPSSVFAEADGRLVVGVEADNEAELALDAYEPTPKRRAADGVIRLGEGDFAVAEVIGAVLAPVLGEAMAQNNNTTPDQVVLTHPVSWRARRRGVLADALKAAQGLLGVELPEPVFVAEPIAAAQWYAHTDPPTQGAYFAVYDLGGGTFDTTVLQATGDGFEVIASGGVDPLGGFDFDAALFDYLGTKYIAPADATLWAGLSSPGQPDPELARQRRRLQQRVGLLKLGLSTSPDKRIQLPGIDSPVVVTRREYEALISGHIDNTVGELEDTIADAGLTPDKLTAIYRIGGAARTPLVGAALDRLRVPIKVLDQPKLVVAQGAATPPPTPPPTAAGRQAQTLAATTTHPPAPTPPPSTVSGTPTGRPDAVATPLKTDPRAANLNSENKTETETPMTRFIYGVYSAIAIVLLVGFVVAAVHGIVHITSHPSSESRNNPTAPPFDGKYAESSSPTEKFDGTLNGNTIPAGNFLNARSSCGGNGCVAVSDGFQRTYTWDYIDGHWITVNEFDDDKGCHNTPSTEYLTIMLSPQPDGSLAGDQIEEWTEGCYQKTPVTFKHTDARDSTDQLPDPSTEPPRHNPPPAAGFHGKYRFTLTTSGSSGPNVSDYVYGTQCLRGGERCLSFGSQGDGNTTIPLVYQNGSWTNTTASDQTCSAGTDHVVTSFSIPLPSNAADPIQTLTGSADVTGSNGCFATGPSQAVFQRTGD